MPGEAEAAVEETTTSETSESTEEQQVQQTQDAAPPPADEKPPEKKDQMGPRFAALAKRERDIVQRDAEIKAKAAEQEQKLKAREEQLAEREAKIGRWGKAEEAFAKDDADGVVEALSLDDEGFKKLVTIVNGVALRKKDLAPEVVEALRKVKQLEAERNAEKQAADDAKKKAAEEEKTVAEKQAEENKRAFKAGPMTAYIKAKTDELEVLNYALTRGEAAADKVLGEIWDKVNAEHVKDTKAGRQWTEADLQKALAEAAASVETDLAAGFADELKALAELKKFKQAPQKDDKLPTPAESRAAALKQIDNGPPANSRPKHLTNSAQQAPAREPVTAESEADPDACFDRALKLL